MEKTRRADGLDRLEKNVDSQKRSIMSSTAFEKFLKISQNFLPASDKIYPKNCHIIHNFSCKNLHFIPSTLIFCHPLKTPSPFLKQIILFKQLLLNCTRSASGDNFDEVNIRVQMGSIIIGNT